MGAGGPGGSREGARQRGADGAVMWLLHRVRVERRVPPYATAYLRQRLGLAWSRARRGVSAMLQGPWYLAARRRAGDGHVVHVDGAWQVAVDFRFVAVRRVAEDNLAAVAGLLGAAGIPYFVRDAAAAGPLTVGVDAAYRDGAVAALAAATPDQHLYARPAGGGRPVPVQRVRRLSRDDRVLIYRNHRLSDAYVVGASHACAVEFWQPAGANLRAPAGAPGRFVLAEVTAAEVTVGDQRYPTVSAFADHTALSEVSFPVDVVYTWVDDTDPRWRERFARTWTLHDGRPLHAHAANASRYRNRDELRYSLRSLALYADFVRRVYIVTDGQVPAWLDVDHPDVRIVDHSELLEPERLPTFNSHAIESRLHHIEGLAEHYLYLNDDFIFGRQVTATTFFTPNGLSYFFPDERAPIPAGPPSLADRPVDSAAKNVRDLMATHLGVRVGRKMLHVPYPQRRSVLTEMARRFPEEFARTARSTFRQPTDVNVASCFSHYYAFVTGRAVTGEIASEYVNVGFRWAPLQMRRLLHHRDRDAICINETDLPPHRVATINADVRLFLDAFLPLPSPYEIPAERGDHVPRRRKETMSVKP